MDKIFKKLLHYLEIVKMGIGSNQTKELKPCDVLFICHDVDRSITLNGAAYAPLIDSIREDIEQRGYKCLSIAHYGSELAGVRAHGNPISVNRKFLKYLVFEKIFSIFRIDRIFPKFNFYKYLFRNTNPSIVFTIGAPDQLCFEARLRNILIVEVLHGVGYQFIPWGWNEKDVHYLPNVVLSLDEVSTASFSSLAHRGVKIFTIPNPFLKRFLPSRISVLPKEWSLNIGKYYQKNILVSLAWSYAGDHGEFTEFAGILKNGLFFEEIGEAIKERKDVFWCFRLHPVQMKAEKYRELREYLDGFVMRNSNCEWIQSSSLPFPVVVANCSGNITMASMSCYDAAAMGVPSLMLCPTIQPGGIHEDWFEDLVTEGYVTKNKVDKKLLQNWVQSVEKIEPRLSNLNDEDSWENAVEWLLSESGLKSS